eukprot:NODE_4350_length_1903_cov_5.240991.p1 GENE.NODE_4350_length_1903_cov_5.240991~~NODE_4350_length_1903_cov_5.240991.p1  ORF type:complete len:585 (+),score=159.64 NODE_4350_length_1903_cov_5.240991:216-1757(+)
MWSFATLEMRDMPLFERAADHIVEHLSECGPQELNNMLWACAAGDARLPWFFLKVGNHALARGLEGFKTHELAIMMWAHAMAGISNTEFFHAVFEEVIVHRGIDSCAPREVSNMSWAYSSIIGRANVEWFTAVERYVPARIAEFELQCIGNTLWAFASVGVFSEPVFRAACGEMATCCASKSPEAMRDAVQNIAQVLTAVHVAKFTHVPFFKAAAECFLQLGPLGGGAGLGLREIVVLCNTLLPAREHLERWPDLDAAMQRSVLKPLLEALPPRLRVGREPSSGDWATFAALVGEMEIDNLGLFYTSRFLRAAAVVSEAEVLGFAEEPSTWARAAAHTCIEERAHIVAVSAEDRKVSRQLDRVNKREIVAWLAYDVQLQGRQCVETGRCFFWRPSLEEASEHAAEAWLQPITTRSRRAPTLISDHDRSGHAERGALLDIAASWLPARGHLEGWLRLYITHFPCISCVGVIAQFAWLFPTVQLSVAFADGRVAGLRSLDHLRDARVFSESFAKH